jgi:hypothetical protein
MNKKKIIFTSVNMNMGGVERSLVILLNSLIDKYDVTLVLENKKGNLLKELNSKIKIIDYKLNNDKNIILRKIKNFSKKLNWIIKNKNKYDFSCSYCTYSLLGSFIARISSKNNLLYIHSDYYNLYNKNKNEILGFFEELNYQQFKYLSFVSNESKNNLANMLNHKNMLVISNLLDYKSIEKLSKEETNYKKKSKKTLLFVGRLEEESKNIIKLLKIMKNLKKEDISLIIIGDGKDRKKYEEFIKDNKLNNIEMKGELDNPYPYYKIADAVILTSNYEGNPVVLNEALLFEKKIFSTLIFSDKYINMNNYIIKIKDENDYKSIIKELNIKQKIEKPNFLKINENKISDLIRIIESETDDE